MVELTTASQDDKKLTKLAHDTLAPLIRENFEQSDLPGQRAKRILESRKVDWIEKDKEGKPKLIDGAIAIKEDGPVLDEQDLTLVQEGQLGMRVWDSVEQRLIEKSEEEKKRKEQERLAAVAKEKASQRRFKRNLIIFSIVSLTLGLLAGIQWQRGERQAQALAVKYANADKLSSEANRLKWESPQLASLLISESLQIIQDVDNIPTETAKDIALEIVQNTGGRVLNNYQGKIKEIKFSHDNRWLTITSENSASDSDNTVSDSDNSNDTVQLWLTSDFMQEDLAQESPTSIIPAQQATFSPDGQWLLTISDKEDIKLWNLSLSQPEAKDLAGLEGATQALFSHNSELLITIDDKGIIPWHISDSELQAEPESLTDSEGTVIKMAFSKDDSHLALGMKNNTIELWNLPDFERKAVFNAQQEEQINNIVFGPENCCLIGYYEYKSIIWDLSQEDTTAEPIVILETRLAPSPDQNWLVTIEERLEGLEVEGFRGGLEEDQNLGYSLKLWDFGELGVEVFSPLTEENDDSTSKPIKAVISEHINTFLFSPDNQWFIFLGGRVAKIINLNDLKNATTFFDDLENVRDPAMVFASDGDWLATIDGKFTNLWSLTQLETPPNEPLRLAGHEGNITALDLSPDNRWLVTGSNDQTVRLWDLEKGPLNQIEPDASVKEIIVVACASAGRNLTLEEWKDYIGESTAYRETCSSS